MPKVISLQTTFNSGVLDPRLSARSDIKHFYQGAAEAINVMTMPQGGVKRRPGFKYVATINAEARLASFAFNVEQTYLMVFTNLSVAIYKDGVHQANVVTPYTTAQLFELQWTQSADTMILVHKDHQPRKLVRGAIHTSWTLSTISLTNIPQYDYEGDSTPLSGDLNESATTITVDSTAGFAASGKIQINSEVISYTGVTTGPDTFTGCTRAQNGSTAAEHTDDDLVISVEDVWSVSRGWPKSATFYQSRLWFGGSLSRPQTLWGSKTNDFYNYAVGTGLDDEGIDVTLDTDQVNAVTSVYAGRHLNVFTTGGEFSIQDSPITPAKVAVKRQTLYGSTSIPPKMIDGSVIFIDRTGKSVREFLFSYTEDAYTSGTVSLLASHLLNSPVDMDVSKGTASDDANYVYFVNGDGSVAVFNTLRAQEVSGWTKWTTNGEVESVAVVVDEIYFVVKRTINGVIVRYLEQLDVDTYTDANKTVTLGAPGTAVTGLAHLNGEACRVRADGAIYDDATPATGAITLTENATVIEVGLNYTTSIKTMPINMDFQDGPTLTRKKRIVKVVPNVYQSLGISINGNRFIDRNFGLTLGSAPTPYTGIKEMYLLGWTDLAQVEITQADPTPMTLLGVGLEVEV